MCRWLAYPGSHILLSEPRRGPANSLINQSLHSRLGPTPPPTIVAQRGATDRASYTLREGTTLGAAFFHSLMIPT
jgi:hypothetical protein